jgi:PAS domain S-box-containing protein
VKGLAHRTGLLLTVLTAFGGVYSLAAWQATDWSQATFASLYLPMAPITALLVSLLAVGQAARLTFPSSRPARLVEVAIGLSVLIASGWSGVQQVYSTPTPWDHWFHSSGISIGNVEFGAGMALLTVAILWIATAAALVDRSDPPSAIASAWLSAAALAVPALSILSHIGGFPLLYGHRTVALHTAMALSALASGRLLANRAFVDACRAWIGDGDASRDHAAAFMRRTRALGLLALFLTIGAAVGFLRSMVAERRGNAWREIEAVAALRADDVAAWRRERLNDAISLLALSGLREATRDLEAGRDGTPALKHVEGAIDAALRAYGYEAGFILDRDGRVRLIVPASYSGPAPPPVDPGTDVRMRGPRPGGSGGAPVIDVAAPLGPSTEAGLTLVLLIDPLKSLYPLLERSPLAARSISVLLVRREGDEVVNLNDLPGKPGSALRERRSIRDPILPAARAVAQAPGVMEGVDHRVVPIVSASRRIAGTDWVLVVSARQTEIYRSLRDTAMTVAAVALLVSAIVVLIVGWFQREHEAARLGDELKAEKDRAAVAERLALLMRSAHDLILVFDREGRLRDFNESVVSTYGYTPQELAGMRAWELRADGNSQAAALHLQSASAGDGIHFASVHRRKDGSTFPVEVSARVSEGGEGGEVLAICRDVTQRQAQEAQLHRLARLYEALAHVNEAVVRTIGIDELLRASCRALAESAGFRMVWVGAPAPGENDVSVIASFGDDLGYLDSIRISTALTPEGLGPTGLAIRENRTEARANIGIDPAMLPWQAAAARVGYRSSISVPMRCPGGARGALTAYAVEPDFFDREVAELLERAARDIGFGIESREQEARRQEAEDALRKISEAVEQSPVSIVITDLTGRIEYVNPYFTRVTGYTIDEARGQNPRVLKSGETPAEEYAALWSTITAGGRWQGEFHNRRKDGTLFWEHAVIAPVRDASGRITSFVAVKDDISERRAAEKALEQSEERLRLLTENATDVIWTADTEGFFTYVSPAVEKRRGVRAQDLIGRPMTDAMTAESIPMAMARFHEVRARIAAGEPFGAFSLEVRQPCADGSVVWTEVNVSGLYDGDGRWLGVVGVNRDIGERKRAEAKLAARINELLHFQSAVIGREERVMELKREVNTLARALGRPAPYPSGADA